MLYRFESKLVGTFTGTYTAGQELYAGSSSGPDIGKFLYGYYIQDYTFTGSEYYAIETRLGAGDLPHSRMMSTADVKACNVAYTLATTGSYHIWFSNAYQLQQPLQLTGVWTPTIAGGMTDSSITVYAILRTDA